MNAKKWIWGVAGAVLAALLFHGTWSGADHHLPSENIDCTECHTCEEPTLEDMCLKACPRLKAAMKTGEHAVSEAPGEMLLDELVDLYQAVHFDHKLHAEMSVMGSDCATCHHYSPEGEIPPCKECHGAEGNPTNLRQPGLKGAYHRQCLGCHREWSHETKCIVCHVPVEGGALEASYDSTDILGIAHPVITEPETEVYHTEFDDGPVVTFHHKEHIELYGLACA
ncbi:MAG: hypothetical protein GF355_08950, partial [Candidatus Eisenbacteria bacterium]|nr:hypothetical protein [Candidatus Eisenbacteria bacterium]